MSTLTKAVDTANSIIDTVQAVADSPLMSLIGLISPRAATVVDIIRRYGPTIDAAQPVIKAAVEAGEPAFEKAVEVFPKIAVAVSSLTHLLPVTSGSINLGSNGISAENVTRLLGGLPRMTFEEEMAWMNRMTPGNDPSQENSKFTIG